MHLHSSAFTIKSNGGLLRVLISDIDVHIPGKLEHYSIKAIWDTGATGSAISKHVAQQLGLIPSGIAEVNTAGGTVNQSTYTIDIGLPNKVLIQGIVATEIDALTGGCDALIGMDVINLGDLSITNHKGITCMSFRFPSSHEIDYVKNPYDGITPTKNLSSKNSGSNFTPPKKKRK
jgi:hypothetical protein